MNYYLFRIFDDISLETAQTDLEKRGLKDTFVIEDDALGEIFIGGHSKKEIETPFAQLTEKKPAVVNWDEQWSLFAENFHQGKAHIQLGEKTLLLTPGAGFGDLSHPTTYLMLEMMKDTVSNEHVIDIGTGSGILALSALLMGAKSAIGIDIDPASIQHAKENAKLNQLKATFTKTLPKKLPQNNILLMNMIFPEQIIFAPEKLNQYAKTWIVSGILAKEKEAYLAQAKTWGWKPLLEQVRSEWVGFIFSV
ncbi:MAG: hypothetical protein COT85_06125 [Chlamydiae bacterium CG10_big_fil_rev_8_21_14_0_10_42_34]|nr:MAG: hypothetical protein COT85_06125 [Chlamydiae bacterium CG10_big_fil_rev_8_21_14_0_10_42_34]